MSKLFFFFLSTDGPPPVAPRDKQHGAPPFRFLSGGVCFGKDEQSDVQRGETGKGGGREMTHMSHMWRHQMMHADRLEQKFVIDHIRWTTSRPWHEPDSWKVMWRLWIFRLGHTAKPLEVASPHKGLRAGSGSFNRGDRVLLRV